MLDPALRRTSTAVQIGPVRVGGGAPIVVQSMTDTDTADVAATVAQVEALARAGSELVRVTVNTEAAARAVPAIRERLDATGCRVPLIGDFHYNGHRLLADVRECAEALAKYRINPGNVGFGTKRDTRFAMMIEKALEHDRPVRIGVNWGSLDQALLARLMDENAASATPRDAAAVMREALVRSALESALEAERMGLSSRPYRALVQGKRGTGPDRGVLRPGVAQRSRPAPGTDRGGNGLEGHRRVHRGHGDPPPARYRRHHPRFADSGARRRPGARGHRRAGNPADDRACARSRRSSPRVPGAGAPRAPSSASSPTASRVTCASACRSGANATRAWRTCRWR